MKSEHLTEEALQAYLLKELEEDNTLVLHLLECAECQRKLESYQYLVEHILMVEHEALSFDVTTEVMEKIVEFETHKMKNANIGMYIGLSIISIVALVLLYPYIQNIFIQLKSLSLMENAFILVSVLGVVIFLLNDLFRQYKQKETLLLQ